MTATLRGNGIWRFADYLGAPSDQGLTSLGEGSTPLIELPRLAKELGLSRLIGKLEGCNPTGSYKDRAAAMSIMLALNEGRRGWVATSSGNAGASLAAYGARAGLRGLLFVVPSIPREKLAPILTLGTSAVRVRGLGSEADPATERQVFAEVRELARRHDLYLGVTAHAFNPEGMRGVDTLGLEIATEAPSVDLVYVPSGGGGLITALERGLRSEGKTSPLVLVQPQGCAPIVSYLEGELDRPVIAACSSKISALQLPCPPDGELAAEAVRRSRGWGTAVGDELIIEAQHRLAESEGVLVEAASAATLAALEVDLARGRLERGQAVLLVLTGTGLKNIGGLPVRSGSDLGLIGADEIDAVAAAWTE